MTQSDQNSMSILDLTHEKARQYFLKQESYCGFDLPIYFRFEKILQDINDKLADKNLSDFYCDGAKDVLRNSDDINYKMLANEDGKYTWRPFQLIHPALYVSLVQKITAKENWEHIQNQFKKFAKNKRIECMSIPRQSLTIQSDKAEQISNWWKGIEQRSIEAALDYPCLMHTDITNCYGSIYTHSVTWAMHGGKDNARENKNERSWVGNQIDWYLQDMSEGQTNGIPQGSALMDFIAEVVLGYADRKLSVCLKKAKINDYKILRYRDDYRIFSKSQIDGSRIMKSLTEILIELGFKLSADKTNDSLNIIEGSIKPDKFYWMRQKQEDENLQKHILLIYDLSLRFPNCGSLRKSMTFFYNRLYKIYTSGSIKERVSISKNATTLISIATDIANKSPKTYPHSTAIISLLLQFEGSKQKKSELLQKVIDRFQDIPNTEHLNIWMQRIALRIGDFRDFDGRLCKLAKNNKESIDIWNNSWLNQSLRDEIDISSIFDIEKKDSLPPFITPEEIALFRDEDYNYF